MHVAPRARLIIPEVVVVQRCLRVEVLAWEAQAELEHTERTRVLVRCRGAKRIRVPTPHDLVVTRSRDLSRRVEMIRVDVVDGDAGAVRSDGCGSDWTPIDLTMLTGRVGVRKNGRSE